MTEVNFVNKTETPFKRGSFFKKIAEMAVEEVMGEQKKAALSVVAVESEEMQELNRRYRGKDAPTDVLAFKSDRGVYGKNEDPSEKFVYINGDVVQLGDIIICPAVIRDRAGRNNSDFEKELAETAVHGVLHLLGYDHERSAKDGKEMFEMQEKISMQFRHKK